MRVGNDGRLERIPKDKCPNVIYQVCQNSLESVSEIVNQHDKDTTLHINAALKTSNDVCHKALKYLTKKGYYVMSLPQESFQLHGIKGKLNYLKWFVYLHFTFRRKIMAYGITGFNAERHFRYLLIPKRKVFQFMYVTKNLDNQYIPLGDSSIKDDVLRFIYVGAIDERKNIIPFVDFMQKYPNQNFELKIYGSWSLDDVLRDKVKVSSNIHYYGKRDYDTVREEMTKSDYLVIPSLYDGWAAVGNEGLQAGCKLLVSRQSGCSILVSQNKGLGYVFSSKSKKSMQLAIEKIFSEKKEISQHQRIKDWADEHISPNIVAKYFDNVIKHYFNGERSPNVPWITKL